jgi:hypothetical protein
MIVIEEYSCENKNQAEARERYWIETQQATLNKIIPTRTRQEYYVDNIIEFKERYIKNRESLLIYKKEYNEKNKDKFTELKKQYYEENREEILEKQRQYYEENKEEINKKRSEKLECECGGKYTINNKSNHSKTKQHMNYLNNLNNIIST